LINSELLARLSKDFVDVERRAKSIARHTVMRTAFWAAIIAAIGPIMVGIWTIFSPLQSVRDDVTKLLSSSATKVEEKDDFHKLETDVATMKVKFDKDAQYENRLQALERKLNALTGGAQ
jgi:hypothetical protein